MGLLTYDFNISLQSLMIEGVNEKDLIKKEVDFLLTVLPRGTEFLDAVKKKEYECLYIPYVLTFGHPIFENGTKIQTNYYRVAWVENNKLEQQNLFLGIRYINSDGTDMFHNPSVNDVEAPVVSKTIGYMAETIPSGCGGLIGYQAYSNGKDEE